MSYCTGALAKTALASIAIGLFILLLSLRAPSIRSASYALSTYQCSLSPFKPACYHLTDGVAGSRAVAMTIHDTAHLQMNETESSAEFLSLLPSGGHTVSVPLDGPGGLGEKVPHTVALFHQLRCIDVLREAHAKRLGETKLSMHCMNYVRQSILCLSDSKLEPGITPFLDQHHTVDPRSDYVCKDWTAVYAAAEKYQ